MKSRRIDKLGLCQNFGTHPLLQTGFRHQIDSAPDQAFQFFAQRSKLDQANPSVRFKGERDAYMNFPPDSVFAQQSKQRRGSRRLEEKRQQGFYHNLSAAAPSGQSKTDLAISIDF